MVDCVRTTPFSSSVSLIEEFRVEEGQFLPGEGTGHPQAGHPADAAELVGEDVEARRQAAAPP